MSYKRHFAGPSRTFDHLYDPNYITPSSKDVWRANTVALTNSAKMHIIPVYDTMFTDLPRRQRNMYVLQKNPLPYYSFYDGGDHYREPTVDVGAERSKFCFVPIQKPKGQPDPPSEAMLKAAEIEKKNEPEIDDEMYEKSRDIGCQTLFRESSAQTQPWLPNAIIGGVGTDPPEVIYVTDLIKTNYYPGQHEAEIVERARGRREFEKSLPDFEHRQKKKGTVRAFEWQHYVAREDELQDCQRIRLGMVEQMIAKREKRNRDIAQAKIENYKRRAAAENEKQLFKIRNDYQKNMRRLEQTHRNITKKYKPMDITVEHIDRASDLYGPQKRFGNHPRQKHFSLYKSNVEPKIQNLEEYPPVPDIENLLNPKPKLWEPKPELKEVERGVWSDYFLSELYDSLKEFREVSQPSTQQRPRCLVPIGKIEETPQIEQTLQKKVTKTEDLEYNASIILQSTIKGCAVQNNIFRGREKCRSLIAELQSYHLLSPLQKTQADTLNTVNEKRIKVLSQQKKFEQLLHVEQQALETSSKVEGYVFCLLDVLFKELERLRDMRRSANVSDADDSETESLQQTDWEGLEYDQLIDSMVTSASETVSMYLENVIDDGQNRYTDEEATEFMKDLALEIEKQTIEAVESIGSDVVRDLINEFLIPGLMKKLVERERHRLQSKQLEQVHNTLYGISDDRQAQTDDLLFAQSIIDDIIETVVQTRTENEMVKEIVEELTEKVLDGIFGGEETQENYLVNP